MATGAAFSSPPCFLLSDFVCEFILFTIGEWIRLFNDRFKIIFDEFHRWKEFRTIFDFFRWFQSAANRLIVTKTKRKTWENRKIIVDFYSCKEILGLTWFQSRAYLILVTSSWGSRLTWTWIIKRQNAARSSAGRFSLFVQLKAKKKWRNSSRKSFLR